MFWSMRSGTAACALFVVLVVTSSAEASLTDGLMHYWPFDEDGGVVAHDIVGGNDGLLVNWTATEARWVRGHNGNGLDFGSRPSGGDDNYVVSEDPIVFDKYTLSFFMQTRPDDANIIPRIIGPEKHYWLVINRYDGRGVGFEYDWGRSTLQDSRLPVDGRWEHYALTLDRTTGRSTIFRDGFPVATGKAPNYAQEYPVGPWYWGHPGSPLGHGDGGSFSGLLDDFRIYDRILSPDEVVLLSGIATAGDFDHNGLLDVIDIDALSRVVRGGQNPAEFDVNSDGRVDQEDRRIWVEERKSTYFGDANLDRRFDTSDLVQVFIRGKYEKPLIDDASWQDGDWNGDGLSDSNDLVTAFVAGGYEQGPRMAVAAVPEPGGWLLVVTGLPLWLFGRHLRRAV